MTTRKTLITAIAVAAGLTVAQVRAVAVPPLPATERSLRVGVYDSRSVALAFGRSKLGGAATEHLMAEAKQAEKDGDQPRLESLKKKGNALQNLRHMQVFGNAPIRDMLDQLQPALEEQARAENLDLIVRDVDIAFQGSNVKLVDITKAIVDSCHPTKETLRVIEEMKHHAPLPLEQFPIEHVHGAKSEPAANPAAEADAVSAAKRWLEFIDSGTYEDSWKESSAHFQRVVPRDRWLGEMQNLRTPLGKVISREVTSHVYRTELPDAPPGEYVVIQFKTGFEHDQDVIETVTPVREADGTWKVDGYYIR